MKIQTSDQPFLELGFGGYQCNWGIHIAGLYETKEERDAIMLGFLSAGMCAGDLEMYCYHERSSEEFLDDMSHFSSACTHGLDNEEIIRVYSSKELYYPDGTFSPLAMDKGLGSFFVESQAKGSRNVRATAEMVWALEAIPGKELLMVYESRLNYFIPGKPWISICMYNLNRFSGNIIMDVLRTHPYVANKGVLTENPYYQDPDIWLRENAPQFLPENLVKGKGDDHRE